MENQFDKIDCKLLDTSGRIIHQIWYNFKDPDTIQDLPHKYVSMRDTWINNNPEWTHILWNDKMGDWLVYKHYHTFWDTYSNYKYPIQRVDAIRLCILHRYGGIYVDIDTDCFRSINPLINSIQTNIAFGPGYRFSKRQKIGLSNYFMYSKPNEDFWLDAINGAISYGTCDTSVWYFTCVFNSAGPNRLRETSKSFKGSYHVFNPEEIGTMTEKQLQKNTRVLDGLFVLHKNNNEWLGADKTYFHYFGFSILIMILFVVLAMIISVKAIKINHNNQIIEYAQTSYIK